MHYDDVHVGRIVRERNGFLSHAKQTIQEAMPMAIPAAMFTFQQVLLIAAASYLDAVSYQVFNQAFKILPTAIFAHLILGQKLEVVQWASIPVLAAGVMVVTLNNGNNALEVKDNRKQGDWLLGILACAVSGSSSAFAGVYFEKYLKGKYAASLWVRNIQLSAFGLPFSGLYAWFRNKHIILRKGWLQGFTVSAWSVVALQVFGGLVSGMVVKYCDNVIKNFSVAVSIILTVLLGIPLFGQWPSLFFLIGVALVMLSVLMYGQVLDLRLAFNWLWSHLARCRGIIVMVVFGIGIAAVAIGAGLLFYNYQFKSNLIN
jgi:UDP-sugar transporter A1/2/3